MKLLFIHEHFNMPLMKNDADILRTEFDVTETHGYLKPALQVFTHDLVYIFAGDYHAFLPVLLCKMLGKRCYIMVAGQELICSGRFPKPRKWICKIALNYAYKLFVPSRHTQKEIGGELVYNCISPEINPELTEKDEKLIVTVGGGHYIHEAIRKGLPEVIELARRMPDYKFVLIGHDKVTVDFLNPPRNVTMFCEMPHSELIKWYKRASIYLALVKQETFGIACVEAMAYGCVPIGSDVMREVIGYGGYVGERWITKEMTETDRGLAMLRSKDFTFEKRKKRLLELITDNSAVYYDGVVEGSLNNGAN